MANQDTCCTLAPYFEVHEGKLDEFKAGFAAFVEKTQAESGCMHYGFSVSGDEVHCREGYQDAEGVLAHLDNVGDLFGAALQIADLTRLEVHAPASEVEKLREPLSGLNPQFFTLVTGFRR
jgi:hypothetical protein